MKKQYPFENDDELTLRCRDLIDRMERKWEFKKALQDSRRHQWHSIKLNRLMGY